MFQVDAKTTDDLKAALQLRADSAKGFVKQYAEKLRDPKKALHEMSWRHCDAMQQQCRHDVAMTVLGGVEAMEERGNDFDTILSMIRWSLQREVMNAARDTGTSSSSSSNQVKRFGLAEKADLFDNLFGLDEAPKAL